MEPGDLPDIPLALNAVPLLTPPTGIGQYTYQLASRLRQLWPQPPWLFYGTRWERELRDPVAPTRETIPGRMKRAVPMGHRISRALQQMRFSAGARRHRIGLYHETNYLAFRFGGPTVVTVHDLSWIRYPEAHPLERVKNMNAAMPRVMREATRIIADSEFTRGEIIAHYGVAPERVHTVLLGVLPDFHPRTEPECEALLRAHELRFGRFVLAVGTLEPRKNLATTVAAFARLPQALRREFPLVIAGASGWGESSFREQLEPLLARGEARVAGYVAQAALPLLYAAARASIYPSLYEGFGLPPLESMASGVPVVCSSRASLPEIVGDAALVAEALDVGALSEHLRRLLEDDRLHRALSQAGVAQASPFTWERCARQTVDVYLEAVRAPRTIAKS